MISETDSDEGLPGYLPGDELIFAFHVEPELFESISVQKPNGVDINNLPVMMPNEPLAYEVGIEFKILKRTHHMIPEDIKSGIGFRSSGASISFEAAADEGEDLFLKL
jgi:hypothetical protein